MAYDSADFKGPNGVKVANILRVADLVERSATFDMSEVENCGAPACILGHAAYAAGVDMGVDREWGARYFGLSIQAAADLFLMSSKNVSVSKPLLEAPWAFFRASREHAAACLRKLAETGEVDWLGTQPQRA
jgi:hypothetical protein